MNAVRNLTLLTLPFATNLLAAEGHDGGDPLLTKKFINFAILAVAIGYLVVKTLVPALKGQQKDILEKLNAASKRAEEAAAQAAEMDRKIAGLSTEVAALRETAARELQAETARIERETAEQLEKVKQSVELETASAVKAARQDLKAYSAELAVGLARTKIAARLDDAAQQRLVSAFTSGLNAAKSTNN